MTRNELRATNHTENQSGLTKNRTWDGSKIKLFGAKNEVVSFNLVLEAGGVSSAASVSVQFDSLLGPGGARISSIPARGNEVFDWTRRQIELFYARYLQIHGLSYFGYNKWDERQIPIRFQRPHLDNGNPYGEGGWYDRPDHDKYYPDPLVPLELVKTFDIAAGQNQSIWADIYIPKSIPTGVYNGLVSVTESGEVTRQIPVQLSVYGFSLPDDPSAKAMGILSAGAILSRHVAAGQYINWDTPDGRRAAAITDKYFQLFHRHKIALLGENECPGADHPCATSIPRMDGSLYTAAHGYDGPGVGVAPGIFSIGTYGAWSWKGQDEAAMWRHTDSWVNWFQENLPETEFFLYLQDEPKEHDWESNEGWARWIRENPGPGKAMPSLVTISPVTARAAMPSVTIPMTGMGGACLPGQQFCDTATITQEAADYYQTTAGYQLWGYNDGRPSAGSSMTEDDGVAMRTIPWVQHKMKIGRWMYWYVNPDGGSNLFQDPVTFGTVSYRDYSNGESGGDGTSNGNGLLVYPGTDLFNPSDSYNVDGPIASLRLKEWRRGLQDVDYLSIAEKIDPVATKAIQDRLLPKAMWQYGGYDPNYYTGEGPAWSSNPDDWEAARAELSSIIASGCLAGTADNTVLSHCTENSDLSNDGGTESPDNLQNLTITSSIPGASFVIFGSGCATGYHAAPSTVQVAQGSLCMISMAAPDGFVFTGWADNIPVNPRPIVMSPQIRTLVANFKVADPRKVAITVTSSVPNSTVVMGGSGCPVAGPYAAPSTFALAPGTQCSITALVPPGYRFRQWSDSSIVNPMVLNVPRKSESYNVTLEPIVPINPSAPSLTIRSNIEGASFLVFGSGCAPGFVASPITLTVTGSSLCSVTAVPPDGTHFEGWSDGNQTNPRAVFVQYQPVILEATFR